MRSVMYSPSIYLIQKEHLKIKATLNIMYSLLQNTYGPETSSGMVSFRSDCARLR